MKNKVLIEREVLVELYEDYVQARHDLSNQLSGGDAISSLPDGDLMSSVKEVLEEIDYDVYNITMKHDGHTFYISEKAVIEGGDTTEIGFYTYKAHNKTYKERILNKSIYGHIVRSKIFKSDFSYVNELSKEDISAIEEAEQTLDTLIHTPKWEGVSIRGHKLLQEGWSMIQDGLKAKNIAQNS